MFIWVGEGTWIHHPPKPSHDGQLGANNEPRYSNPAYDALVDKQATLIDEKERQKTIWEAQRLIYEECPYVILSYDTDIQALRSDKIKGMEGVAGGAILYANTNVNYLRAVPAKAQGAVSALPVAIAAAALVIIGVLVAILVLRGRKRGGKANWDKD